MAGSLAGCSDPAVGVAPDGSFASAALPPVVARLALSVDVSTRNAASGSNSARVGGPDQPAAHRVSAHAESFASLVGVDGVRVEVGRMERSVLGRFSPGKVRVFLAVRLHNALDRTRLLTPTLPTAPSGEGIYLFGVQSVAIETPGGVSVAGNTVLVESPSSGRVEPSAEWDGAPYDYLRSGSCAAGGATCARWERFAAPLAPGGTSDWRTVSYDIDPTVHHMRLRFIVGADLANAAP
jgi:hypothetical protein